MSHARFLVPLALVAAAGLLGCGGLDTDDSTLPTPAIFLASDAVGCNGAGASTVTLSVVGAQIVEGYPQSSTTGVDRIRIDGTAAAGETVYGLLIDDERDCPIDDYIELTAAADGSFTVLLAMPAWTAFRVVAVTGPAGALPICGSNDDCIELDVSGAVTPVSGISNAVGVRL